MPSTLSGRPVTFSVLSLCPVLGPMLHINMLGHTISCMWSFYSKFDLCCVYVLCVRYAQWSERERERERDRETERESSKWMPYTYTG